MPICIFFLSISFFQSKLRFERNHISVCKPLGSAIHSCYSLFASEVSFKIQHNRPPQSLWLTSQGSDDFTSSQFVLLLAVVVGYNASNSGLSANGDVPIVLPCHPYFHIFSRLQCNQLSTFLSISSIRPLRFPLGHFHCDRPSTRLFWILLVSLCDSLVPLSIFVLLRRSAQHFPIQGFRACCVVFPLAFSALNSLERACVERLYAILFQIPVRREPAYAAARKKIGMIHLMLVSAFRTLVYF